MLFDESSLSRHPHHRAYISSSMSVPSFPTFSGIAGGENPSPIRPSPSSSSTSSSSVSRLQPPFAHNARVSLALVPAAAFLLDLGGAPVSIVLTAGLIVAYILDSLRLKSAAFFAVWFSLIAAQLAFFASASSSLASLPLTALALLLCAEITFLIGLWASLQFRWIQIENPSIVGTLERLLFACIPVAVPPIFTWAVVSAVGMANSAYYFMAFACLSYWLYSLPRTSSFRPKHEPSADSQILGPLESCLHTLFLLFAPLLFRVASHHSTILSFSSSCDLLLLFFIPFLFQLYASTRGALWWVSKNELQIRRIRVMNGAVATVVVVICLEFRVVFHSFSRYVHAPPPLNYLLVTVTMLGGALSVGAYALGMVDDALSSAAFTTVAVFVSGAGALVIGFPLLFIPLPLISGFYLARFFTKRSLPSYFAFVTLAGLMVLWFVVHNFWDLNIWMGGMDLKSFCKFIVASAILAMVVPGLVLFPPKLGFLTELALVGYTLLLCYIEDRFFNYTSIYYFGFEDDVIYPSYMVLTTTLLGFALIRRLAVDHRVGPKTQWILTCLYASKLTMLFISSKSVIWVSALLLLAISPPLLLYRDKLKGASKMKSWQGHAHACVVAVTAWFCRETIFEALQWWNGMPPSDGLLLGSYVLLTGIACIPIVALHFSHAQQAKRILVLVVATGLLLVLLQPPIPISLAFRSDLIRAALESSDDYSIYGFVVSRPSWPSWLLIATILLTLAAVTNIIPIKHIVELRTFYAVGVGITLGIYVCAEYFFQAVILYPLLVTTIICASVFIVFTYFPSSSSTRILPWVFALMVALLPVSYLMEGQIRAMNTDVDDEGNTFVTLLAIEGARMSLLGLYAMLFMLISLVIKFELATLMREKVFERGVIPSQPGHNTGFHAKSRRRASAAPAFTIKRLVAEASWMPAIGNLSTILCFIICLIINMSLTGGPNLAIFFLSPILLLLNQDSDILASFGDRQRYFPVTLSISMFLMLNAIYKIWEEVWHGNGGWGLEIGGPGWFFAVKNAALLILTLPNHILFNRFMWDYAKVTDSMLLLTMPLNLPSIIITDISTIRILGFLGVVYSLVQYLISRSIRMAGMKYI